jgi:hypothetical protein
MCDKSRTERDDTRALQPISARVPVLSLWTKMEQMKTPKFLSKSTRIMKTEIRELGFHYYYSQSSTLTSTTSGSSKAALAGWPL